MLFEYLYIHYFLVIGRGDSNKQWELIHQWWAVRIGGWSLHCQTRTSATGDRWLFQHHYHHNLSHHHHHHHYCCSVTNCILLMSCSYAVADCCMQLSAVLQPGSSDREQELALVICCLMTLKQAIFTVYTLIFDSICSSSYQKCLSESESVRCTKKNLHRLLYKGQSCTASIETF